MNPELINTNTSSFAAALQNMPELAGANFLKSINYLNAVKSQLSGQPEVYEQFLDIMKDVQNSSPNIEVPDVVGRVCRLFQGYPTLIQDFSSFLPLTRYQINISGDNTVTLTSPDGTVSLIGSSGL